MPLLEVEHLQIEFPTRRGVLRAVDDISFTIGAGEVLGVVGESGAGKSLTGAAIIGLLEPPGHIAGGRILFDGRRIDNLSAEELRRIRGKEIGAIFQDPLTSLNPLYTVGPQLTETVFQWPGMGLLIIQAISFADIPVMSAYLVLIAFFFVLINLVVDLLYYAVDPRLRIDRAASGGHGV